jgi:hypothetical protein
MLRQALACFLRFRVLRKIFLLRLSGRWVTRARLALTVHLFFILGVGARCTSRDLVILGPFHSGAVYIFDLAKQTRVATLPVEDGAGVVGIGVNPDRESLYVVDGNIRSRLRKFDTQSWQLQLEQEFANRRLALGAEQVIHLTADNRWLLIETYDVGAASPGVRVFDLRKDKFTPAGLPIKRCERPLFASAPDGTVAAVCAESVEFFRSKGEETLSKVSETEIPFKDAVGACVTPRGEAAFILGGCIGTMPQSLIQIVLQPAPGAKTWELPALGVTADPGMEPQASMVELDRRGNHLLVAHGPDAWLLTTNPIRLRRSLSMPSPIDGAQLSPNGEVLYTLRRDLATKAMLLGRTVLETGKTTEAVLLEDLPFVPVVWRFAVSAQLPQ